MKRELLVLLCAVLVLGGCRQRTNTKTEVERKTVAVPQEQVVEEKHKSPTEQKLDSIGFVNIKDVDPSVKVEIVYATPDNFTGKVLYADLNEAYLHPEAAAALAAAQKLLKEHDPELGLLVYDAARPMSAQAVMWDEVKGTSKRMYVSNPGNGGGLHNYGLAVDLTIIDKDGKPLSMGTGFDHLGKESHITDEVTLVREGKITEAERRNRMLLREVMTQAGFRALDSEWWHFNLVSREVAREKYQRLDF